MSTILERLKLRTGSSDEDLLNDLIDTAKSAILTRRYPYGNYPTQEVVTEETVTDPETGEETTVEVTTEETFVEDQYIDLQFRIALDLYNKIGAEAELSHNENGISRTYESSWISKQLLLEVVPKYSGV